MSVFIKLYGQSKWKWRWKWKIDYINMTWIDLGLVMDTHIVKNSHTMMMLICVKQHLSNTWSSVHEKAEQHWDLVLKKYCL